MWAAMVNLTGPNFLTVLYDGKAQSKLDDTAGMALEFDDKSQLLSFGY